MALFTQRNVEFAVPAAAITPMAAPRVQLCSFVCGSHQEAKVCELNFTLDETSYGSAYPSPIAQVQAGSYATANVFEGYRNMFLELEYGFNGVRKKIAFDAKPGRYFIGRVDFANLNLVQWYSALAPIGPTQTAQSSISDAAGGAYDIPTYTAVKRTDDEVDNEYIAVPIGAYEMEGIYTCDAGTDFWGGVLSDAKFQGSCNPLTISPSTQAIIPPSGRVMITPTQHTYFNEQRIYVKVPSPAPSSIDIGCRFYLSI